MDRNVLEWKKVNLFDISKLPYIQFPITSEISSYCFNEYKSSTADIKTNLVICDKKGNILIYLSNWECISFNSQPTRSVITLCSMASNNWLATASLTNKYGIHINIYDLGRLTRKQGAPIIASAYFQGASTPSCINAESIDDKLLALAVGFENGNILLHYGRINKLFSPDIRQHTVSEYAIKGIHFDFKAEQPDMPIHLMFITCFIGVYCFVLKEKSMMEHKFTLDDDKKNINHCSIMRRASVGCFDYSMLVVGRGDAIYCYTSEGRGPLFAIKGTKKHLAWIGHTLIVSTGKSNLKESLSTLIALDTENKIIVFQNQFQNLSSIIYENDFCYIITNSSVKNTENVFVLKEINVCNKIKLLNENNMYDVALRLLHQEGCTFSPEAAMVHFQFGNNLLLKGDISTAVQEFIKTIGFTKPYDVISKLLDSKHNSYLTDYLTELKKIYPNSNLTDLIECCTTRKRIKQEIQLLSDRFEPLPELKHLSKLSKLYFECTLKNQSKAKADHILNRFLQYGPENLTVDSSIYLDNIKSENVKNSECILSFFSILPDHNEYCAKILGTIIETFPLCDERLYFYLCVLYLSLLQESKVAPKLVLDFLKKECLRTDKFLIVCRLNSFLNRIHEMHNHQQNANMLNRKTVHKCIHTLMKNNIDVDYNLNISKRSFLMMLKSVCHHDEIKTLKIKPIFMEKDVRDVVYSANEEKLMEYYKNKIRRTAFILSLYTNNPIQFRNDTCGICCETLKMRSIYFVCQHSFHKECLNYASSKRHKDFICIVCKANMNYLKKKKEIFLHSDSANIISVISKVVAIGAKKLEADK
ncbi:vacuolar protein sorting-associated protein 11 homolog [Drosophila eugracilis]|uniref:vacuolar protein sorting-associated protein 11 homolog n=1 Tax=Drosophila eugracilis TaxID=29029 RepID=UPI001BD9FB5E|nr:vacuolar protein sorting-associated protein 11 homolog [Drosophila eugracilis]